MTSEGGARHVVLGGILAVAVFLLTAQEGEARRLLSLHGAENRHTCHWMLDGPRDSKQCAEVTFKRTIEDITIRAGFCKPGTCKHFNCIHFTSEHKYSFPGIGEMNCAHFHCGDVFDGHKHHTSNETVQIMATTRVVTDKSYEAPGVHHGEDVFIDPNLKKMDLTNILTREDMSGLEFFKK